MTTHPYSRIFSGKTTAPTINDDSADLYEVGDIWLDETNNNIYQAIDVTVGAAIWKEQSGTTSSGTTQVHEDLTSLTNGIKNAFGSLYVIQSGSSTVYYNGVRQRPVIDYTDVGSGIVLGFAPETSGVLLLDYLTPASGVIIGSGVLVVYSGSGDASGGTYTPTISGSTNVISASVANDFMYMKIGSYITVNGSVYVDPNLANTNTYVYMSLPVSSNLTSDGDLMGVATCAEQSQPGGTVEAGIPEDRAMLNICPANVNGRYWNFTFMYKVK